MTDKIYELIKQSEVSIGDIKCFTGHIDINKFTELIVRECVGVVEGGRFLHDQAPTAIFARECSHAIKRHFGVEE
jgi:hypothetical protein